MDNIAVEAYALSCVLPLIAFILLAFQFYSQSSSTPTQNATVPHYLEEVPCNVGGLISISSEIETKENKKQFPGKEKDKCEEGNCEQLPL